MSLTSPGTRRSDLGRGEQAAGTSTAFAARAGAPCAGSTYHALGIMVAVLDGSSLRRFARALVGVLTLTSKAWSAHGEGGVRQRAVPVVDQRFTFGVGDTRNMQLELIGAGVRWRLTSTLELSTLGLALFTAGSAAAGEPGPAGYGGELSLRLRPWPHLRLQPFAYSSIGLLLFPQPRFLPGADVYEGILSTGIGLEAQVTSRLALGTKLFMTHLSNGQGLGPFNPAYDGFGAGLELSYALEPLRPLARPPESKPRDPPSDVGLVLDAQLGAQDDALLYGGRARLQSRLAPWLIGVGDVEGGTLAGRSVLEMSAVLAAHTRPASAGLHGGYRRYAGFDVAVASAQVAGHLTRETSLIALAALEHTADTPELWRFAVGARFFPTANLGIDLGVGFDRVGQATWGDDHSDPYFDIEWALPLGEEQLWAVFVERQISGLNLIGLRAALNTGRTLLEADRTSSWRRLR